MLKHNEDYRVHIGPTVLFSDDTKQLVLSCKQVTAVLNFPLPRSNTVIGDGWEHVRLSFQEKQIG